MLYSAQKLLLQINSYSITGSIVLLCIILSLVSQEFYKGIKMYLWPCILVWILFFGYEVKTGNNLFDMMTGQPQTEMEAVPEEGAFKKLRYKGTREAENVPK